MHMIVHNSPSFSTPFRRRIWESRSGGGGGCGHRRQDKLYILEKEGILHKVSLLTCPIQENLLCSCP